MLVYDDILDDAVRRNILLSSIIRVYYIIMYAREEVEEEGYNVR